MNALLLYQKVCEKCSELTTTRYSTSFSLGIKLLDKSIRPAIYGIYGFVRFMDEIVDTFHDYDKTFLFNKFKTDCYEAIDQGISLNPILHSFQSVVNKYEIDHELIEAFIKSMFMDLSVDKHDSQSLDDYIVGSAEVVGLMCLTVFVDGDKAEYERLKPAAQRLGAAFQKVNFLRDLKEDTQELGRQYFPNLDLNGMDNKSKADIEADINADFDAALVGIKQLPTNARFGVYLAYRYYRTLFNKIARLPLKEVASKRVRISNGRKLSIMVGSYATYNIIGV